MAEPVPPRRSHWLDAELIARLLAHPHVDAVRRVTFESATNAALGDGEREAFAMVSLLLTEAGDKEKANG